MELSGFFIQYEMKEDTPAFNQNINLYNPDMEITT